MTRFPRVGRSAILLSAVLSLGLVGPATLAKNDTPYPGTHVIATKQSFEALWANLEKAIKANRMGIVARASASRGAAGRGRCLEPNGVSPQSRSQCSRAS